LTRLTKLDLQESAVSDTTLANIKGLTHLKELALPKQITDKGLVHLGKLANLEKLELRNAAITDEGLLFLAGLSKLRTLYGGDKSKVTEQGIDTLRGQLPKLTVYKF